MTVIIQQQKDFQSKLHIFSSTDVKTNALADRTCLPASTHSQFENAINSDVKDIVAITRDMGNDDCTIPHGARMHTQFKNTQNMKVGSGSVVVAGSMSASSFAEALSRKIGNISYFRDIRNRKILILPQEFLEVNIDWENTAAPAYVWRVFCVLMYLICLHSSKNGRITDILLPSMRYKMTEVV